MKQKAEGAGQKAEGARQGTGCFLPVAFCLLRSAFCLLPTAFCLLFVVGCARDGRKPVYPVHGKVLDSNNKPAAGALLVFHLIDPADQDITKPLAHVADDGTFALTTYVKDDGAPEGEYAVTIEWQQPSSNPFDKKKQGPDQLKGRYSDPAKSKIHFKVEKKPDNEVPAIQLQ
jgi:hypothetical protein